MHCLPCLILLYILLPCLLAHLTHTAFLHCACNGIPFSTLTSHTTPPVPHLALACPLMPAACFSARLPAAPPIPAREPLPARTFPPPPRLSAGRCRSKKKKKKIHSRTRWRDHTAAPNAGASLAAAAPPCARRLVEKLTCRLKGRPMAETGRYVDKQHGGVWWHQMT